MVGYKPLYRPGTPWFRGFRVNGSYQSLCKKEVQEVDKHAEQRYIAQAPSGRGMIDLLRRYVNRNLKKVLTMETDTIVIRTGLQELKRQLKFRKTMLERRKERIKEQLSGDEWKIRELAAKVAELEKAGNQ